MVDEAEKSSVTEEPTNSNPRAAADDGKETEEGEIVGDDREVKPTAGVVAEAHPLEHSWTFWFDNPSAKSKQATWGSSIRPIHTFSTGEEFWRYIIRVCMYIHIFMYVYLYFVTVRMISSIHLFYLNFRSDFLGN